MREPGRDRLEHALASRVKRHRPAATASSGSHWDRLGAGFPSLKGAASTAYYRVCEERLFHDFFPALPGRSVLKTDLWDEAKNTEILEWAARHGPAPLGIDVAFATVRSARARARAATTPGSRSADVRAIPLRAASCDLVYSMGTIEHLPDPDRAIDEIFRVLQAGRHARSSASPTRWIPSCGRCWSAC